MHHGKVNATSRYCPGAASGRRQRTSPWPTWAEARRGLLGRLARREADSWGSRTAPSR